MCCRHRFKRVDQPDCGHGAGVIDDGNGAMRGGSADLRCLCNRIANENNVQRRVRPRASAAFQWLRDQSAVLVAVMRTFGRLGPFRNRRMRLMAQPFPACKNCPEISDRYSHPTNRSCTAINQRPLSSGGQCFHS